MHAFSPQALVPEIFSIYRRNHLHAKPSYCSKTNLMHFQCPITTLLFSTIVPSAHTQPTNNDASTITTIPSSVQTSPAINADVICTPFIPFHFRPKYQDCNAALGFLPDSHELGIFHTGGLADGFRLPVNEIVRTCEIKVHLLETYEATAMGTWSNIRATAARVANECHYGHGMEHTGGMVLVGRIILISLVTADGTIVSGLDNATIAGDN